MSETLSLVEAAEHAEMVLSASFGDERWNGTEEKQVLISLREALIADGDYEVSIKKGMSSIVNICHKAALDAGWWSDLKTGESLVGKRNVGEMLCLVHSEISEAMEAHRKNLMDDKLHWRKGFEVELADAVIRIADLAGAYKLDLGGAIVEKMRYNAQREDHKIENRRLAGGKAY